MERTYTVDELLNAVRRRWKWMAVIAAAVFAIAAIVIAKVPNEYRARALAMTEPLQPNQELVVPVISTQLYEKVKNVRSQVYSRQLMASVIDELGLYPKEREKDGMDAAVEALRLDTEVHAEGDDAFSITVRSRDPVLAAKTANRLAELFIEGNLQVRANQVARTRDVISQQLVQMRGELSKVERRVADYKSAHADTLPELNESRMRERDQIMRQIEAQAGFIQTAQNRIDLIGVMPFPKDTEVGRFSEQYDTLRAKLGAARVGLTPDHPDVVDLTRQVAVAKSQLDQAQARAAADDLELRRMKEAVSRGKKQVADYQTRIAQIDKLLAAAPLTATGLSELERDSEMIKAKVQSLISKKAEAEITADLEAKNGPSLFRVLESASPPALPSAPNRPQALLLALLGALALGAAIAAFQELSDRTLRTEAEAATLQLPVLATVPRLAMAGSGRVLALPAFRSEQR
ncbi:MAG: GumC family protein [Myxococcales bacterium]